MGNHPVYAFCEGAPSHGNTLELNKWSSLQCILEHSQEVGSRLGTGRPFSWEMKIEMFVTVCVFITSPITFFFTGLY